MEKKVKDIMIPIEGIPTIPAGAAVKEAVSVLGSTNLKNPCPGITAAVVVDRNEMVGTIGFNDLVQALDPAVLQGGVYRGWSIHPDLAPAVFFRGLFTEKCRALGEMRVRDIMKPVSHRLDESDTLSKAVHLIIKNNFEPVPVWQNDRVVGMVGSSEIIGEALLLQEDWKGAAGSKRAAG
ncbi:MAG: CBS domain-containing protein [Firmicutes bacterium]|nr:CBS domain-containing protein [Bacillota bacterium]